MANILGRGLDVLLGSNGSGKSKDRSGGNARSVVSKQRADENSRVLGEHPKESVFWIEVAKIKPNPEQPRMHFDEEKIRALAESIRQYGILQPIVVSKLEIDVPTGTQVEYQIIAGERRYRAAQVIGLQHMPAVIRREESDKIKLELALIENLQREDLHPLEKARAYKRLIHEFNLTAREVGFRVGKSREAVANTVRLLLLPDYIQNAIASGRITEGQARPLISIVHNAEEQRALFQRVVGEGMVARDVEQAARQVLVLTGATVKVKKTEKAVYDAATRSLEAQLASALGTRVLLKRTQEGKGKISIEFFSDEEFQNVLTRITAFQPAIDAEEKQTGAPEASAQPDDLSTFTV